MDHGLFSLAYGALLGIPFLLWYHHLGKMVCAAVIVLSAGLCVYWMHTSHGVLAFFPFINSLFCIPIFLISDRLWPWSIPTVEKSQPEKPLSEKEVEAEDKVLEKISERDEKEAEEVLLENSDLKDRQKIVGLSADAITEQLEKIGEKVDKQGGFDPAPSPLSSIIGNLVDADTKAKVDLIREIAETDKTKKE